jgi:hypothetical protein
MDTTPYSLEAFANASSEAHQAELARRLQAAVEAELSPTVREIMSRVVSELNQVGHELTLYDEQSNTCIHYRHQLSANDRKLLLACDIVVTSVFGTNSGKHCESTWSGGPADSRRSAA